MTHTSAINRLHFLAPVFGIHVSFKSSVPGIHLIVPDFGAD